MASTLGVTFVEARALFAKHAFYYQEGLASMPATPFRFYVRAFADYLASGDSQGDADGASSFLALLLDTIQRHRELLDLPCESLLMATARRIALHQGSYEANFSIYGDFAVCMREIERAHGSRKQSPAPDSKIVPSCPSDISAFGRLSDASCGSAAEDRPQENLADSHFRRPRGKVRSEE